MKETDKMLTIQEETATSNQATLKSSLTRRISPERSVSKESKETKITGKFKKL